MESLKAKKCRKIVAMLLAFFVFLGTSTSISAHDLSSISVTRDYPKSVTCTVSCSSYAHLLEVNIVTYQINKKTGKKITRVGRNVVCGASTSCSCTVKKDRSYEIYDAKVTGTIDGERVK